MKVISNKKGLTLIEVIIAMAILGIISVSFLGMFSSAVTTIYFMGDHSKSVAEAQTILDLLYEETDRTPVSPVTFSDEIASVMTSLSYDSGDYFIYNYVGNIEDTDFYDGYMGEKIKLYWTEKDLIGQDDVKTVSIMMFYRNNSRHISLTTPMPDISDYE